jgi:hypothetical protein
MEADTNENPTPITSARKKKQQTEIPGTERKMISEVEHAASELRMTCTSRIELQKVEAEQRLELIEIMKKHGITVYKFHDDDEGELTVEATDKTKVSVRKAKSQGEDE